MTALYLYALAFGVLWAMYCVAKDSGHDHTAKWIAVVVIVFVVAAVLVPGLYFIWWSLRHLGAM
jgi:hypothetical protein